METELKFVIDAEGAERLRADLQLPLEGRRLRSVYFDTPDMDLKAEGFVLRVREENETRVQGIKQSAHGGVFKRHEWETPLASEALDFAAIDATPLGDRLSRKRREALIPAFEVDVLRAKREVDFDGARIEIALDEGEVRTLVRREAIRELELELISGSPAALFALARTLGSGAPTLSFRSKSNRGFALARDRAVCAEALAPPPLHTGQTAAEGFHAIAAASLAQIAANAEVLRARRSSEAVHQLRVGGRRLRSTIRLFEPMLGGDAGAPVVAELRWLARECDAARNLDVFAEDSFAPIVATATEPESLAAFALALERRRAEAHERARQAACSDRFRALLLEAAAWIEAGAWASDPAQAEGRAARLGDFAHRALQHAHRRVMKRAKALDQDDARARHRLRVADKILRYAVGGFAEVFDYVKDGEVKAFKTAATEAQDALGALTDIQSAQSICAEIASGETASGASIAFAAGFVAGHLAAGEPPKLKRARKAVRRLKEAKPFW